jgi:hypothetical protein
MTMIVSGSDGIEFPDGSDQTSAFTGNASSITSGTIATARLATGTANATTFLRGDQTWATVTQTRISGGTTGLTPNTLTDGDVTLAGTLAVGNGGTGATTLTANNVLLGNGTSALQTVAPGSNGNVLTSNGTAWTSQASGGGFPTGTVLIFAQTTAPTGWTKNTSTGDNSALRVVTGTASTGGSVAFTTAFASQTPSGSINTSGLSAGATTLTTAQIPSHQHLSTIGYVGTYGGAFGGGGFYGGGGSSTKDFSANTGGGGSHTHTVSGSATFTGAAINLAVQYIDVIRATKD